jgi:hypothetical protein
MIDFVSMGAQAMRCVAPTDAPARKESAAPDLECGEGGAKEVKATNDEEVSSDTLDTDASAKRTAGALRNVEREQDAEEEKVGAVTVRRERQGRDGRTSSDSERPSRSLATTRYGWPRCRLLIFRVLLPRVPQK